MRNDAVPTGALRRWISVLAALALAACAHGVTADESGSVGARDGSADDGNLHDAPSSDANSEGSVDDAPSPDANDAHADVGGGDSATDASTVDGGGVDGPLADSSPDAPLDAPTDTAIDAPRDAASDAPSDAATDAPADAGSDVTDPCSGIVCASPPANTCASTSTLTVYASTGTCAAGQCTYASQAQACQFGCSANVCDGDPCIGKTCDTPPAALCTTTSNLHVFTSPGSCSAGACNYGGTDVTCPHGCASGKCLDCQSQGDCPGGSWCSANTCVSCASDAHCGSSCVDCTATSRVCGADGTCVQCVTNQQCASGNTCSGGTCVPCNTAQKCGASCVACAGTTPACNAAGTACECTASSCGAGATCTGGACVTTCSGTIVDWNWNAGTGATPTVSSTALWSVGVASVGPSDGKTYLATGIGGVYPDGSNGWARLPKIDLSGYATCKVKVTVSLWRQGEKYGNVNYDGGNMQYTTDPNGASGWAEVGPTAMSYDGQLLGNCGDSSCVVYQEDTWTTSNAGFKTATWTSAASLGSAVTFRFTWFSDYGNVSVVPHGLYVGRVLVEATP